MITVITNINVALKPAVLALLTIGGCLTTAHANTHSHNTPPSPPSSLERDPTLAQVDTLKLCLDYNTLTQDSARQKYKQELDFRAQLSTKDHALVDQHTVENSMTRCGMYMALGKPLQEHSRQIRPLTFKTVHIYPDKYYVSQSGMIVETLERKPGTLPPKLIHTPPSVQPPPVEPK